MGRTLLGRPADRSRACTLLLAAAYLYATSSLPYDGVSAIRSVRRHFRSCSALLFALAAVLLLFESRRPQAAAAGDSEARIRAAEVRFRAVVVGTALFFALLEPIGYLIAFTIYLFLVMFWLHRKSPFTCLVVAVLFSIGSYALFAKALGVSLAKGLVYF